MPIYFHFTSCINTCMFCVLSMVVCLPQGSADTHLISCFHDLSKQLAVALRHEEKRCGFLSEQASKMCSTQDDMASQPEGTSSTHLLTFMALPHQWVALDILPFCSPCGQEC